MTNAILGLRAETSLHAGTGQTVGAVDLPIQREAHTGWPCVFGSAMKGALRAHAEMRGGMNENMRALVFGPGSTTASEHAGALAVTDARILLLPVRSLTGHFKLVTCPAVLARLARDMNLIGKTDVFEVPKQPQPETVLTLNAGLPIFLEEYEFKQIQADLSGVIALLAKFGADAIALQTQLVVLHDDDFTHFSRSATAIAPHIAIDNGTKTVRDGSLWYEETLPPDTLLYTLLLANDARKSKATEKASEILKTVTDMFAEKPYLQIGGNETVGMGWCKVTRVQS
jgi:CRISPR-associated protein Cmr4